MSKCIPTTKWKSRRPSAPRHAIKRLGAERLAEAYKATLEALASAIASKDSYERFHGQRVQVISQLIGSTLGLSAPDLEGIAIAALLHDAGKLGVPDYILLKPGPLERCDFVKVQDHAAVGAKILADVNYPWDVTGMVRHHHEHFDGTGYPDGLSGEAIPIGARVIGLAEVYDALTSARCYREAWLHEDVERLLCSESGKQFDPNVVTAFMATSEHIRTTLWSMTSLAFEQSLAENWDSSKAVGTIAEATREEVSLLDIFQRLSDTINANDIMTLLARLTRKLFHASTCVVFIFDELHPGQLKAGAVSGLLEESLSNVRISLGDGLTGAVAIQAESHAGDSDLEEIGVATASCAEDMLSCLISPIAINERVLGTLNVYAGSCRHFTQDDLRILNIVAARAFHSIQNAEDYSRMRESAMHDPLTGLYNVAYLTNQLETEISRCARKNEPVSIVVLDMDNFKAVNDTFGHYTGDRVLKMVSHILKDQLREYDAVVRTGGDEFVVVLPGAPRSEALETGKRLKLSVEHYARQVSRKGMPRLGLSYGTASFPEDGISANSLLAIGDDRMYENKRTQKSGREAA